MTDALRLRASGGERRRAVGRGGRRRVMEEEGRALVGRVVEGWGERWWWWWCVERWMDVSGWSVETVCVCV